MKKLNRLKILSLSILSCGISLTFSRPSLAEPTIKIIGNCETESCETLWNTLSSNFPEKTQNYQQKCLPPEILGLSVDSNSHESKVVFLSCWEPKIENGERTGEPLEVLPFPGYEQQFGVKISSDDPEIQAILNRNIKTVENMSFECGTQGGNINILGNVFIVATHADPSISNTDLPNILNNASARLYNHLNETAIQKRREATNREITLDDVQQRFFTFSTERPDRCQRLLDELTKTLVEYYPESIQCRVDREINAIKNDNQKQCTQQIEKYQQTLANIEESRQLLKEVEANEPARQREMKQRCNYLRKRIKELGQDTEKSFQKYAESIINVNSIEKTIRKKYNNKKEAQEYVAGYLVDLLQSNLETLISTNSEKLKAEIDAFLEEYPEPKLTKKDGIEVSIPFDKKGAFLGGIAGLGAYGALATWAAGLGNLGGYILVAKLVSLLSALGISIGGGTAAVISFVAAIGGPIALGIGLAAGLASLIFGLFGEAWQSRLAKQIVKYFQEQDVCGKLLRENKKYWQEDTATAFEKGAEALETASQDNLEHLRELVSPDTNSKERIEEIIKKLEVLQNFFADIPWTIQGEC